ncbi:MAG: hypothetical protein PWP31_1073 [Clostridia bacterium]|nr:hypothetical protein [Clostridia bacterium]
MWGKKKRINIETAVADTVIGKGVKITGNLVSDGAVRIDGFIEGEVTTEGDLVVGETGKVVAKVKAANLLVVGIIKGDVETDGQLEIAPTGKVEGNVHMTRLVVEPGGVLLGHSQMPVSVDTDTYSDD